MARSKLMRRTNLSGVLLPLFLLTAGCSDDGKDDGADTKNDGAAGATSGGAGTTLSGELEVITFWGKDGGDFAAIENAANVFAEANPDVTPKLTSVENGWLGLQEAIDARLTKALPMPGVFQRASDDSLIGWNDGGHIQDLTEMYTEAEPEEQGGNALQDVIPQAILDTSRFDDKYLTVGVNLHRTNGIFYNKRLFAEHGLEAPTTIEEFKDLVIKLKSDVDLNGGAPLVVGNVYNWTFFVFVFTCLGPHLMGPEEYKNYFNGSLEPENEKLEELLNLALFLRCGEDPTSECDGYFNADMDSIDHLPSIDAFIEGFQEDKPKYAMTQAGDWVKGWMKDGGLEPGVDFDQFVCPVMNAGDTPVFTGGVDSFAMPSNAANPEAAMAFMKFLGSKEGQLAINQKKGAIPIRNDINLADYPNVFDAIQVKTYTEFQEHIFFDNNWKPGAVPSLGEELKFSFQKGTIERAYNYLKTNYSTLK